MGLAPCIDCKITINIWYKQKKSRRFHKLRQLFPIKNKKPRNLQKLRDQLIKSTIQMCISV